MLAGKAFGQAGAYEKIIGKVHFTFDPARAANQHIVDIDKAPRDTAERVRFSADLYALVPKHPSRQRAVLFEERYSNRATYEARVNAAAVALVAQKYLLAGDQAAIVAPAMARWDAVTQGTPLSGR